MEKFVTIFFLILLNIKIDAQNPSLSWAKKFSGNSANSANIANSSMIDFQRNVYTTGHFRNTCDFDPGPGTFNLTGGGGFISKLDSSGNFVWAKQFSGLSGSWFCVPLEIYVDVNGNIYTIGFFDGTVDFDPGIGIYNLTAVSGTGYVDFFVSKIDVEGNFVWARQVGNWPQPYLATTGSIIADASGNIYITASFIGTADFDPGPGTFFMTATGRDPFILKLNSNGNFVWAKQVIDLGVGSNGFEEGIGFSIFLDAAGNVYSVGQFNGDADFDPGPGDFNMHSMNGSA